MTNAERYDNRGKSSLDFPRYFCESDGECFRSWECYHGTQHGEVIAETICQVSYCEDLLFPLCLPDVFCLQLAHLQNLHWL